MNDDIESYVASQKLPELLSKAVEIALKEKPVDAVSAFIPLTLSCR